MTFLEFQTNLYDDLSVTTSDSFYTQVLVKRYINRVAKAVAGAHPWPHTQKAVYRTSAVGYEYYDYPSNLKEESIRTLYFNGDEYEELDFADYLKYKEDYGSNASNKYFANYENKYFINPTPTVAAEITLWGQEIQSDMSSDSDTTPFSSEPELEEAIYDITLGKLLKKGRGSNYARGDQLEKDGWMKVEFIWDKVKQRMARGKIKNRSMFKKPDLFPGGKTSTGRFSI